MSNSVGMTRKSNFELLRIISMLFIVFYHIIAFYVCAERPDNLFFQALKAPLHMGVLLFVLISGYFGIHCSLKGLVRLLAPVFGYYLLFACIYYLFDKTSCIESMRSMPWNFLPLSGSPYWFVRTYLCLYFFSPIINKYLSSIKQKDRVYLVVILLFFSTYLGAITHSDPSLVDGKNIVHFVLLYVLGNSIKEYEKLIREISANWLLSAFLALNTALVLLFSSFGASPLRNLLWHMSFSYNGIILLLNALLVFVLVSKMNVQSGKINVVASSAFAVYILHHHPFFLDRLIAPITKAICSYEQNTILLFFMLLIFSIVIYVLCTLVDKLFRFFFRLVPLKKDGN